MLDIDVKNGQNLTRRNQILLPIATVRQAASTPQLNPQLPKQIFYVFNGDADGIIATHQLRLAHQTELADDAGATLAPVLLTGVKRDINLLDRLLNEYAATHWATAKIYVCDISLDSNAVALYALLDLGATVHYFDHHRATAYVPHTLLHAYIDTAASTCSSLIVDKFLQRQFHAWAIAAAFGDGLQPVASKAFSNVQLADLARIGRNMNYNAYGDRVEDLHYSPETLLAAIQDFADPLRFLVSSNIISRLENGFNADLALLNRVIAVEISSHCRLWTLPDAPASRRANGSFANQVAAAAPYQAHVILTPIAAITNDGEMRFSVSIRAPGILAGAHARGADHVAIQFATGGGRSASAGINVLPQSSISALCNSMRFTFG